MENDPRGPRNQSGVSKIGLLLLMCFIALFLTVGLKVGPLYLNDNVLTSLADELVSGGAANEMTQTEIRQRFATALRLNNIYNFDLETIRIYRNNGQVSIDIAYERRVPIFANLDAVAVFAHTAQ